MGKHDRSRGSAPSRLDKGRPTRVGFPSHQISVVLHVRSRIGWVPRVRFRKRTISLYPKYMSRSEYVRVGLGSGLDPIPSVVLDPSKVGPSQSQKSLYPVKSTRNFLLILKQPMFSCKTFLFSYLFPPPPDRPLGHTLCRTPSCLYPFLLVLF